MKLDLDAIEARERAATPGPWSFGTPEGYSRGLRTLRAGDDPVLYLVGAEDDVEGANEDETFIAHARTDIPALVARVRELEAQVSVAMNAATLIPRHDDERALEVLNTALAGDALPRNCWSCENHTAEGCRIVDLGMPQGGDGLSEEWENTMAWCRKTPMPNAMPPLDADGCPGYAPRVAP